MRRKLVKQGPSTLTISLPAAWVQANKLKPGGEIDLVPQNNQLIITTNAEEKAGASVDLDVSKYSSRFIGTLLSALHKKGCDEVRLHITKEQFPYIENRVKGSLLGFEIVNHDKDLVVIHFVTKVDKDELPALIRHAFFVTISMAEAVMQGVDKEEALILEETNNRITNYCERVLNQHTSQEENVTFRYLLVWLLEKLADEYRDVIRRGDKTSPHDAQVCAELIRKLYNLYYKYSFEQHNAFINELDKHVDDFTRRHSSLLPIITILQQTSGSLIALQIE